MPELAFEDGHGAGRTLAALRNRVVLLNIWATWCVPCREEMPALDRLQQKLGGPGFELVALSIDSGGAAAVKQFYDEIGIRWLAVYVDPASRAMAALGLIGIPTPCSSTARDAKSDGAPRRGGAHDRRPFERGKAMTAYWTRRAALKTLAAGGGMLAMPSALRTAFAGEEPDLILRVVAAPAAMAIREGLQTRGLRHTGELLRTRDAVGAAPGNLGPTLASPRRARTHRGCEPHRR